jgi:hypothetical protein
MQLSFDKQYLVFGGMLWWWQLDFYLYYSRARLSGYDGQTGVDGVTTSVPRVVGRVNSSGIVEKIATLTNTFNIDSFR